MFPTLEEHILHESLIYLSNKCKYPEPNIELLKFTIDTIIEQELFQEGYDHINDHIKNFIEQLESDLDFYTLFESTPEDTEEETTLKQKYVQDHVESAYITTIAIFMVLDKMFKDRLDELDDEDESEIAQDI